MKLIIQSELEPLLGNIKKNEKKVSELARQVKQIMKGAGPEYFSSEEH